MENRHHNRLTVAPRIGAHTEFAPGHAALVVSSDGLGPGVIESFDIYIDGHLVANDTVSMPWSRFFESVPDSVISATVSHFASRQLLRAGQDYPLLTLNVRPGRHVDSSVLESLLSRAAVQVRYCSIYGDQCETTYVGTRKPPSGANN